MSRTLSMNSESRLNLNLSARCGASKKARQMRLYRLTKSSGHVAGRLVRGRLQTTLQRAAQHRSTCRSLSLRGVPGHGSSRDRDRENAAATCSQSAAARLPARDLHTAPTFGGQQHDQRAQCQQLCAFARGDHYCNCSRYSTTRVSRTKEWPIAIGLTPNSIQ